MPWWCRRTWRTSGPCSASRTGRASPPWAWGGAARGWGGGGARGAGPPPPLPKGALGFAYRHAAFPPGAVIIEATFALEPGDPAAIRRAVSKLLVARNRAP